MSTIKSRKMLAAMAFVATGAAALAGAATAQADLASGNPDVSFNPHPGGMTVNVQSWQPDDTNCTYNADGIRRDFFLPGHHNDQANVSAATASMEFPGVPLFHNWNITITCKDGKSVSTTHWY
jgi:hypothetical protein